MHLWAFGPLLSALLAPTGALILMMVYYISAQRQLFQIFTQSIDSIDVTSVDVTVSMQWISQDAGDILGISLGYL